MTSADRPVLRSRAWAAAGAAVLVVLAVLLGLGMGGSTSAVVLPLLAVAAVVAVLVWAGVRTRRARRDHEDALTAWAAERAVQQERLRIARDLHDLASHGLGLISVRAAAARTVAGPVAAAARTAALRDIERVSREATTELRRMLAVLRSPDDAAPLRPAPTLADLPRLVDDARTAGVRATLDTGALGAVSPGAQLVLCAVVREGLANVARHAGPTTAQVRAHREGAAVVVTVTDAGPAVGWVPHPGAGTGLLGLREQVRALDGSVLGRAEGAGFRLTARLPDASDPADPEAAG